jgi:hypothetical protein
MAGSSSNAAGRYNLRPRPRSRLRGAAALADSPLLGGLLEVGPADIVHHVRVEKGSMLLGKRGVKVRWMTWGAISAKGPG